MMASAQNNLATTIAKAQPESKWPAWLFDVALNAGRRRTWWRGLLRRPATLRRLDAARLPKAGGHCAGRQEVKLKAILGSEGRTWGFDDEFHPLTTALRQRWQRVASAREEGLPLPPVVLIRVGGAYYVRDGHHRVSVARALGQVAIEAEVIVWDGEQGR